MTKLTTLAGLALALVTGSAAAMPGAAPAGADDAAQTDDTDRAGGPPADAGPPASLPDQVPSFVGGIHDLVSQQIDGSLDGDLGSQISDLTPGGA